MKLERRIASGLLIGAWLFAACGGGSGTDGAQAPGKTCARTQCDVDYEDCPKPQSLCDKCLDLCSAIDVELAASCIGTCGDVCTHDTDTSECGKARTKCQSTPTGKVCLGPAEGTGASGGTDGTGAPGSYAGSSGLNGAGAKSGMGVAGEPGSGASGGVGGANGPSGAGTGGSGGANAPNATAGSTGATAGSGGTNAPGGPMGSSGAPNAPGGSGAPGGGGAPHA